MQVWNFVEIRKRAKLNPKKEYQLIWNQTQTPKRLCEKLAMDFYEDNPWFMKRNVLCVWLNISILMNGDNVSKVEKILKGNLDWIPSPSTLVKIQIMGGKVCLNCLLTSNQQCFCHITFLPIIWIFTEDEGDGIKSKLSS